MKGLKKDMEVVLKLKSSSSYSGATCFVLFCFCLRRHSHALWAKRGVHGIVARIASRGEEKKNKHFVPSGLLCTIWTPWNIQAILALEDSPEAARKNDMTKSMIVLFKEAELGTLYCLPYLKFNWSNSSIAPNGGHARGLQGLTAMLAPRALSWLACVAGVRKGSGTLARPNSPFPSLFNACHAGYFLHPGETMVVDYLTVSIW